MNLTRRNCLASYVVSRSARRVVRAVFAATVLLVNCGVAFAQSWSYENKLLTGADGMVLNASLSGTEVKMQNISYANAQYLCWWYPVPPGMTVIVR